MFMSENVTANIADTYRNRLTRVPIRAQARSFTTPSFPSMVKPFFTWSTATGPPNNRSAYNGTWSAPYQRSHIYKRRHCLTSVASRKYNFVVFIFVKYTTYCDFQAAKSNNTLAG